MWDLGLPLFVLILDQLSKYIVVSKLETFDVISVIPGFFNIILTYNKGVAFGMFTNFDPSLRPWVIGLTVCLALAVVFHLLRQKEFQGIFARSALLLVLGGAIGNIIDRVRLGAVVDFLDFYLGSYHWPAFNVADSAICVGVGFIILLQFRPSREKTSEETSS